MSCWTAVRNGHGVNMPMTRTEKVNENQMKSHSRTWRDWGTR